MITVAEFLSEIETFLAARKMTASAFGKAALGDPNFILELRRGRSPHLATVERVLKFMREAPPAEVIEPAGAAA